MWSRLPPIPHRPLNAFPSLKRTAATPYGMTFRAGYMWTERASKKNLQASGRPRTIWSRSGRPWRARRPLNGWRWSGPSRNPHPRDRLKREGNQALRLSPAINSTMSASSFHAPPMASIITTMGMMSSVILPWQRRVVLIPLKKLKKHCTPTGPRQKRFWNRLKKQQIRKRARKV